VLWETFVQILVFLCLSIKLEENNGEKDRRKYGQARPMLQPIKTAARHIFGDVYNSNGLLRKCAT